jgi:hypothetical protein
MEFEHRFNGSLSKTRAKQLKFESRHIWQFRFWVEQPTVVARHQP